MIPPRSPHGLIQEDLWPDRWMILVSCLMLNCTSRKQVEKVMPEFIRRWPTPESLLEADATEISDLIAPLGFQNRRTKRLRELAEGYLNSDWNDPRELPGVGEYAGRAWDIFVLGILDENTEPNDGALRLYWDWRIKHDKSQRRNAVIKAA